MSSVLYGKKEMGDEGEFEKGVSRFKALPNDRPNSFFQQQKKAEEIKEEIPNRKKKKSYSNTKTLDLNDRKQEIKMVLTFPNTLYI
jgi:hypothetical protein